MKRIILVLLLIAAASVRLSAQVSTAQISGHVFDENKTPLPGVTIVLFNPATNRTSGTMTSERGIYNLVGIQPGRYQLSATFIGYHKTTSEATWLTRQASTELIRSMTFIKTYAYVQPERHERTYCQIPGLEA